MLLWDESMHLRIYKGMKAKVYRPVPLAYYYHKYFLQHIKITKREIIKEIFPELHMHIPNIVSSLIKHSWKFWTF